MLNEILYLLFPKSCGACNAPLHDFETSICSLCRHSLPELTFKTSSDNPIHSIFKDTKINFVSALFSFDKHSDIQELIHNLKYRNQIEIGITLGYWHASKLILDPNFGQIDIVIPVPIHKKKLKSRGYNQITDYARIISKKLNSKYCEHYLIKTKNTKTQSKHTRQERFENISNSIALKNNEELVNKHILLIDDVITTGATIKACIQCMSHIKGIKISVVAIAVTLLD